MSIYRNREGWISSNQNVKFKFLSATCASVAVSFIELQTSYFNKTGAVCGRGMQQCAGGMQQCEGGMQQCEGGMKQCAGRGMQEAEKRPKKYLL